jgi:hypothetical protein
VNLVLAVLERWGLPCLIGQSRFCIHLHDVYMIYSTFTGARDCDVTTAAVQSFRLQTLSTLFIDTTFPMFICVCPRAVACHKACSSWSDAVQRTTLKCQNTLYMCIKKSVIGRHTDAVHRCIGGT